jgi:hypothetical protein
LPSLHRSAEGSLPVLRALAGSQANKAPAIGKMSGRFTSMSVPLSSPWQKSWQAKGLLHEVCKALMCQPWSRRFRLRPATGPLLPRAVRQPAGRFHKFSKRLLQGGRRRLIVVALAERSTRDGRKGRPCPVRGRRPGASSRRGTPAG